MFTLGNAVLQAHSLTTKVKPGELFAEFSEQISKIDCDFTNIDPDVIMIDRALGIICGELGIIHRELGMIRGLQVISHGFQTGSFEIQEKKYSR